MWLDFKSLAGSATTLLFAKIATITNNDLSRVSIVIAIIAGTSTIIYNALNIYQKHLKKKQDVREN